MESQEYPQQEQQMYYAPSENMINKLGASVLELTDPKDLIHQIKIILENYEYTIEGELVRDNSVPPLINKEGQRRALALTQAVVNQNTVMSHIQTRQDVNNIIMHLSGELIKLLMVSRKTFNIKNRQDSSQILIYILNPCFMTLMRCYQQGEKSFLKGSVSEIIHGNKAEKKRGLMNLFGG